MIKEQDGVLRCRAWGRDFGAVLAGQETGEGTIGIPLSAMQGGKVEPFPVVREANHQFLSNGRFSLYFAENQAYKTFFCFLESLMFPLGREDILKNCRIGIN